MRAAPGPRIARFIAIIHETITNLPLEFTCISRSSCIIQLPLYWGWDLCLHDMRIALTQRGARGWIHARHAALVVVAPWIVLLSACGAARPFSISLVPTAPAPIQVGTQLGFRLSSSTAGYASLYRAMRASI